jgi:outer membrane protein TolC
MLARARLLPTLFAGATTPDPLNAVQSRDMFVYIGLEVPVWDGFKRVRNISRQKTMLRQFDVETDLKISDLAGKWFDAQENLRAADAARKSALAQEELARLKERQGDIRYRSGGEPLAVFLEGRKGLVEAQRNTFLKTLDYDLAVLGLRHLSGDLGASYVDANTWQQ